MDAIRRWSDDEFRSMNSQIEMVLQKALKEAGRLPATTTDNEAMQTVEQVERLDRPGNGIPHRNGP